MKRATDSSLGIPSQCVVASKAGIQYGPPAKPRVQYCAKYDPASLTVPLHPNHAAVHENWPRCFSLEQYFRVEYDMWLSLSCLSNTLLSRCAACQ